MLGGVYRAAMVSEVTRVEELPVSIGLADRAVAMTAIDSKSVEGENILFLGKLDVKQQDEE
jgi:hypothetical protein